jgi:tight adherence protein B
MSRLRAPALALAISIGAMGMITAAHAIAGEAARAQAHHASAAPGGPRVAIILLDTNNSPAGTRTLSPSARLVAERNEANAYARALPRDVQVGLILFGDTWRTALAPTTSRASLATALAAIRPAGGTSDGLGAALVGAAGQIHRLAATTSRLLVLTNGEYLKHAVQPVKIPTDVVASKYDPDDFPVTARAVAAASGGRSATAGTIAGLAHLFPALVTPTPTPSATPSRSTAPVPGHHVAATPWRMTRGLSMVLAVVFAALLGLALLGVRSLRPADRRKHLVAQVARYGPVGAVAGPVFAPDTDGKVARGAVGVMRQVLQARGAEPRLAQRLDQAGISRQPAEWALLGVCLSIVVAAALTLLLRNPIVGVLLGGLIGWATMRLILTFKIDRRRAAFAEQLPNVLQLIAGSIQTGFSLAQAIDAVVREDAQPASGEFARALAETQLGVDLTEALLGVATRMGSMDLRWVVMAITIQRETGGNLAEVLRNTVGTMRERAYLRRQVRTLSAEGRLSAYVLLGLPFLIGAWMFYADPAYMRPLYATAIGLVMLIGAILLVIVGAFWMRNMIKVEV